MFSVESSLKILVVDDSETARASTKYMLKLLGHEVFEARDGKLALSFLERKPQIDMVILDLNMPRMNGIKFLEAAPAVIDLSHTPVFLLTVSGGGELVKQVRDLGVKGFLTKPLSPKMLEKALSAVVSMKLAKAS